MLLVCFCLPLVVFFLALRFQLSSRFFSLWFRAGIEVRATVFGDVAQIINCPEGTIYFLGYNVLLGFSTEYVLELVLSFFFSGEVFGV